MNLGDNLFNSLDSPFRPVKTVAEWIAVFLIVFMPITFRHMLMDYVQVESTKLQHQLTQMEQPILRGYFPTPTTVPGQK
jgi:hypothetical protein